MKYIELENGESVTPSFFKVLQKKPSAALIKKFNRVLAPAGFKLLTRKQVLAKEWEPEPHPNVAIWDNENELGEVVELHSDGSWIASFTATAGKSLSTLQRKLKAAQKSSAAGNGYHAEKF